MKCRERQMCVVGLGRIASPKIIWTAGLFAHRVLEDDEGPGQGSAVPHRN